ncbi:hypothetical protein [Fimbriimonas ginsengisoli]|uniref:Toxin-antitoxin system, toxin component, PIN family n=1 Tax=Fimbriimonas ginsengisoli Gsoil 348 TaxID=661478 RepID=A0A068NMU3_FIMGI|nr:hypothetical protein [Fimbriimonas ginsengisoli]AIE84717.1 toxin-antitoxin system, toxin component, PIN family [Fimbriimonas ginsengisoli Gsoil 348]
MRALFEKIAFDRQRVVPSSAEFVLNAVDLSIVTSYTIWDCLILQAAIDAKCDRIYSEDMQHGQTIKGIRIENPLTS